MDPMDSREFESTSANIFELVYDGPDVDNGSMSARELAESITGLTRAFSLSSRQRELGDRYQLRIRDIRHQSWHMLFEAALAYAKASPASAGVVVAGATLGYTAVKDFVVGGYTAIKDIAGMIEAKRLTRGERIATLPAKFSDEGVRVELEGGLVVILPKEQYELLLSQRIDKALAQIVSPLAVEHIESFEIRRAEQKLVEVKASERAYFEYRKVPENKAKEGTEITGTLNSLSKHNLRGTFYSSEGVHVPYRYVGGDVSRLLQGFAAQESIRVRGRVKYGVDGIPTYVEVQELETLQQSLPLPSLGVVRQTVAKDYVSNPAKPPRRLM